MFQSTGGLLPGILAIAAFALTLPFTRIAVLATSPMSVFVLRLLMASLAAVLVLLILRVSVPDKRHWMPIMVISAGVVFGFPLFTSLAMDSEAAAHGGVVLGILPLATAVCGAWINRERPSALFWLVALAGSLLVLLFSWLSGNGAISGGDIYLLLAIVSAAVGYAVGGQLARQIPAWQVISWALAPALPMALLSLVWLDASPQSLWGVFFPDVTAGQSAGWLSHANGSLLFSLLYLGLVSQYGGFLLWYRALALDGIARASQLQLLQPFFTLAGAAILLGETIDVLTIVFAVLILASVALSRKLPQRNSHASVLQKPQRS